MHRSATAFVALLLLVAGAPGQTADRPAPKKPGPAMARWMKSTPDKILKQDDKDGDGYLSRDEVPPFLRLRFDQADLNKDGKLDRKEIAAVVRRLRQRYGLEPPLPPADSPAVQAVLERILRQDADKDGKISRAEARGALADNFDKLDVNKDGYLDRSELLRLAQRVVARKAAAAGPAPVPAARDVTDFDALDRNADGRLTRDEVRGTALEPLFDQIDTNRDGRIDPREFEAFLKKRQATK
jgi:Ca2+-binding EF-hand superfamily protein